MKLENKQWKLKSKGVPSVKTFVLKRKKTINISLSIVVALFASLSLYSYFQPTTLISSNDENHTTMVTTYEYQATVTPNVLHPSGGTIPAGETILKKITTAIPVEVKTIVNAAEDVVVKGEYEVQLTLIAEDLWEKTFTLGEKQAFQKEGKSVSIIDEMYKIDLEAINKFASQAEDETGITPSKYLLEINPTIIGTVSYAGIERELQMQEKLVFHSLFDSIVLVSDEAFSTPIQFGSSEIMPATIQFFGKALPVAAVRTASVAVTIIASIFLVLLYKPFKPKKRKSQIEMFNKKYGNRMIIVNRDEGMNAKSSLLLGDMKSLLRIADEKELPIFCLAESVGKAVYFILDGNYLYKYEVFEEESVKELWKENIEVLVEE